METGEFFEELPMNLRGGSVNLQNLTSTEIMELYRQNRRMPYLFDRAQERSVVEGAEELLAQQSNESNITEKEE